MKKYLLFATTKYSINASLFQNGMSSKLFLNLRKRYLQRNPTKKLFKFCSFTFFNSSQNSFNQISENNISDLSKLFTFKYVNNFKCVSRYLQKYDICFF